MSYPYGPEPYPTLGMVEHETESMAAACWTELERLERLSEQAERRTMLATDEMRFAHALSDCQKAGLAFGFALDAAGVADPDLLLRDLFALMEDRLAGKANSRARKREQQAIERERGQSDLMAES